MDPQQLEALIPSGEQALPASMPAPPSKLKLFLMIRKVKLGLIIAGSVVAVLLLITALAFGVCYRGPVKMDFDPESDVAVTDVSTSGGSEEGFAKAHVVSASSSRRRNVGVATSSFQGGRERGWCVLSRPTSVAGNVEVAVAPAMRGPALAPPLLAPPYTQTNPNYPFFRSLTRPLLHSASRCFTPGLQFTGEGVHIQPQQHGCGPDNAHTGQGVLFE